jgi:hypothetical protein
MKNSQNNNGHIADKATLKMLAKSLIFTPILCFTILGYGQTFNTIEEKSIKTTETTVAPTLDQKTECETKNLCDAVFNDLSNKKNREPTLNKSESHPSSASSYTFTHKYIMQMKDGKRTTDLEYYLGPSGNYFATSIPNKKGKSDMITVMDIDEQTMHMFMNNKGDKSRMSMGLNLKKAAKYAIDETNVSITSTGKIKTILGYTCNEFKVKGAEIEGRVWVTQDANISFSKAFYASDPSKNSDPNWQQLGSGLTLEMDMIDTSKRKPKPINMTCIALDQINITIRSKDYKKLM